MKILLLGATGRTGVHIIKEGVNRGHKISAIARDPEKLNAFDINITQGTPYEYETVEQAIPGCDAVINTLNVSRMDKFDIARFIALSTIGAGRSWNTSPSYLKAIVSVSNLKHAFRDHGRQEEILEHSKMDYTICRAPMLSEHNNEMGVVVTGENEKPASTALSRNSAAEFFLDIIEKDKYIRHTIHLSNRPAD